MSILDMKDYSTLLQENVQLKVQVAEQAKLLVECRARLKENLEVFQTFNRQIEQLKLDIYVNRHNF